MAAEEGFTGLLESPNGNESRSDQLFTDMECLTEFQKDELLKIDSEGRCVITDHGHFGIILYFINLLTSFVVKVIDFMQSVP